MNYPYYSPYPGAQMPVQQRPMEMGQGYPQQQNFAQAQAVGQTQGISPYSRPVSSKEEAMAVGADFSGAPMIFPDMAHNAVYVKRWDFQTGSAVFVECTPKDAAPDMPVPVYATQGDFKELEERLDGIESELERLKKKGEKKKDEE